MYVQSLRIIEKHRRLTSSTPAKIEKVDVIRSVNPVFGNEGTAYIEVSFTYTIDEISYNRRTKMSSDSGRQFVPWNEAKVCYDPSDPTTITEPELFPSQYLCGL